MKVGIKQIPKKTPSFIRKIGTFLISLGSSGSALFAGLGMNKLAVIFAVGGLIGKGLTQLFGE
jgi:hypothetical protein